MKAIARQCVRDLVPDRSQQIEVAAIRRANEVQILRRNAHLDSLLDRLREPRVRRVLEPILAGELLGRDVLDEDLRYVEDLGLIGGSSYQEIANPICREAKAGDLLSPGSESQDQWRDKDLPNSGSRLKETNILIIADYSTTKQKAPDIDGDHRTILFMKLYPLHTVLNIHTVPNHSIS